MKTILFFLLSIMTFGQVGINTTEPTKTLDINGDLRVRDIPLLSNKYVLLADDNGNITKVLLSDLFTTTPDNSCPQFIYNKSNPYYIVFKASGYLSNPNDPIKANNLNFVSAGTYIENNITYYTYSNISGQPLDINNFTAIFGIHQCTYQ